MVDWVAYLLSRWRTRSAGLEIIKRRRASRKAFARMKRQRRRRPVGSKKRVGPPAEPAGLRNLRT
jgi:hypothetical protein